MTPEQIGGLVDRYGIPLVILGLIAWAFWKRRFVLGSEQAYTEERRLEERAGRLAAESALRDLTLKQADMAAANLELADTMSRGFDQIGDLIEGRTPRARR